MSTSPAFTTATNGLAFAQVTTANLNWDGTTGAYVLVYTAGASGGRISKVTATAIASTVAGAVRLFISPDSGTTKYYYGEIAIAAATPSATVAAATGSVTYEPYALVLPGTWRLYASTTITQTINVAVYAGDY